MRLHEDINESTITALSSLPSCQQLALTQVMKGLRPWLYFHMFLKQSSHSIVPHPSPSRHNIPMQWGQVRQKWIRQINRDTAAREHYSIWCATEKSWILKEEWNSALKLLLYCFSGPCIDLQPVSLTCIICKMGPIIILKSEDLFYLYWCISYLLLCNKLPQKLEASYNKYLSYTVSEVKNPGVV